MFSRPTGVTRHYFKSHGSSVHHLDTNPCLAIALWSPQAILLYALRQVGNRIPVLIYRWSPNCKSINIHIHIGSHSYLYELLMKWLLFVPHILSDHSGMTMRHMQYPEGACVLNLSLAWAGMVGPHWFLMQKAGYRQQPAQLLSEKWIPVNEWHLGQAQGLQAVQSLQ